ncbi:MAG: hypothetical protein N3I86_12930, partial [Verrucomicrobiae bacterium]|nr:hypothetical protein [Verrucomicrobiae bacterium]
MLTDSRTTPFKVQRSTFKVRHLCAGVAALDLATSRRRISKLETCATPSRHNLQFPICNSQFSPRSTPFANPVSYTHL